MSLMTENESASGEQEAPEPWRTLIERLVHDPDLLSEAFDAYSDSQSTTTVPDPDPWALSCTCSACRRSQARTRLVRQAPAFITAVNEQIGAGSCTLCTACEQPVWTDGCVEDRSGDLACQGCREDITSCASCDDWDASEGDDWLYYIAGESYCPDCRENSFSWCEDCDEYYHNEDACEHRHGDCDCLPASVPLLFRVPANSHGTLTQDERLLVELPEGFISDEAIDAVLYRLWNDQFAAAGVSWFALDRTVRSLERTWQTKRGNYTRRLSAALHKELGAKLDPGVLSRVGSVLREHASSTNQWHVEFTRDLNQPADAFAHAGSCWWTSEGQSRCALKHWGGMGMRSYAAADTASQFPNGRAWVQPLGADLQPTLDTLNAPAYLVYNGYGQLSGYTAARVLAYLASRTYRKVAVGISHQYVNNGNGFLIADQETCDSTESIVIRRSDHHQELTA